MSMRQIAEFLKVNGALDGNRDASRWLAVPERNCKIRYQLWQGDTDSAEIFTTQSRNRSRVGLMSRFMM